MTTEGARLLRLSQFWARADRPAFDLTRNYAKKSSFPSVYSERSSDSRLTDASLTIRNIQDEEASVDVLNSVSEMFDKLACESRSSDPFGERREICLELAFHGWKQAMVLRMEGASQEWLRVSDMLANDEFVSSSNLADFLYLAEAQKSQELSSRYFAKASDVFLALSILRRDRNRLPVAVIRAASDLYDFLERNRERFDALETAFFLGESSFLCANILRSMGRRDGSSLWLGRARRYFRLLPCHRSLRTKALAVHLLSFRDQHRLGIAPRLYGVISSLEDLEMHYEAIACRLGLAFLHKVVGNTGEAKSLLTSIIEDCRNTSLHSFHAICLANLSEMLSDEGREEESNDGFVRALEEANAGQDSACIASVWVFIGGVHLSHGRLQESLEAFRKSVSGYARAGSTSWLGYARLLFAEALIEANHVNQAREEILAALPILQEEKMGPEYVHALTLLSRAKAKAESEC